MTYPEIRIRKATVIIGKNELNVTILTRFLPKKYALKKKKEHRRKLRKNKKNKKKEEKRRKMVVSQKLRVISAMHAFFLPDNEDSVILSPDDAIAVRSSGLCPLFCGGTR